jgi:hypothetical protein
MEADEFVEYDLDRKDGNLCLVFDVKNAGLCGTDYRGAYFEISGQAQVLLSRDEAIRLFEVLRKYIGE